MSHEKFCKLLDQLEHRHSNRLKTTEDKQKNLQRKLTPKVARLFMETTSIKDYIRYGLPKQGREVGRGHYGTVYESKNWANSHSCVVKSVIPPEDRNLEDLGLEFYYLKSISVLAF